jgi:uncharacterized SAM-binding protein YcdF (DUF218 family)
MDDNYLWSRQLINQLPKMNHPDVLMIPGSPHSQALIAEHAAKYYHKNQTPILVSGANGEADAIKAHLTKKGVKDHHVFCEHLATNTLENIRFSKPLLSKLSPKQNIGILCKDYASIRVFLTAKKELPTWSVGIIPYSLMGLSRDKYLHKFFAELEKIHIYSRKGDIALAKDFGVLLSPP